MWRAFTFVLLLSLAPQAPQGGNGEFRKLVDQIVAQRQAAGEEKEDAQKLALEKLDTAVRDAASSTGGNANATQRLAAINAHLQQLAGAQAPLGENYTVLTVATGEAGRPAALALAANFSLSGPSAVRIYTSQANAGSESWKLAARIDRFSHTDYFDEYLELVPMNPAPGVFLTQRELDPAGRTDERKTGMFMAWRLVGSELQNLWTSDLLERSSYELKGNQFLLEFCAEPDEENPGACRKMQRERYAWEAGWRKQE